MHFRNKKDLYHRSLFNSLEKKRSLFLHFSFNRQLPLSLSFKFLLRFLLLSKKNKLAKIKNRCIFTARSRGVVSRFKVSRHIFKKLANNGFLSGVVKK